MSDTMQCQSIKKGMIFNVPGGEIWEVVGIGDYLIQDGKRVAVENKRRNKWHCRKFGTSNETNLMCFDKVFLKSDWNFRFPEGK